MGAWGVGLYQDDVTCDIKDEYLNWLRVGKTSLEATQEMIDYNEDFIEDEDDAPLFWFALADTQWKYGRLLPEVKEIALKYLHEGNDLKKWEDTKEYNKRKKVLEELEIRLNSEQPPEKKVSKLSLLKTKFNVGDILLYKIKEGNSDKEEVKASRWFDKYVLFKIIGYNRTHIGSLPRDEYYHELNIAVVLNWVGNKEIDKDKINNLEVIGEAYVFLLHRNELKKLDFKVINKSDLKNEDYFMDYCGIGFLNDNILDWQLVHTLDEAYEKGILKIDE